MSSADDKKPRNGAKIFVERGGLHMFYCQLVKWLLEKGFSPVIYEKQDKEGRLVVGILEEAKPGVMIKHEDLSHMDKLACKIQLSDEGSWDIRTNLRGQKSTWIKNLADDIFFAFNRQRISINGESGF